MATYLFVWNPKRWHEWNDLDQEIEQVGITGWADSRWSTGNRTNLPTGSRFFLIRLGIEPKGIMGSGVTSSEPYSERHWDPRRGTEEARYVDLRFDFLSRDVLVPWSELQRPPFSSFHWAAQSSGLTIPGKVAEALEEIWTRRTGVPPASPRVTSLESPLPEGAQRRIIVNAYERNPLARRKCIAHHGVRCKVCDVDLGERFGAIAVGFIHVHHIVPLSKISKTYTVDPIRDLIPVCPTCHAILHLKRGEPFSIPEARLLLDKQSKNTQRKPNP